MLRPKSASDIRRRHGMSTVATRRCQRGPASRSAAHDSSSCPAQPQAANSRSWWRANHGTDRSCRFHQVASTPPGLSTRNASPIARSGSVQWNDWA